MAPVAFMFTKKARILLRLSSGSQLDEFFDVALANGVEEMEEKNDGTLEVSAMAEEIISRLTYYIQDYSTSSIALRAYKNNYWVVSVSRADRERVYISSK